MNAGVLAGPGRTSSGLRRAVAGEAGAGPVPDALASYIEKVRKHAYKVTDEDVAALRAAGYGDDELFELTIAAAWGAARERLEAGMRALRGGK